MTNSNFFIVGKHPVTEALKNPKRKVIRIFLTEESKKTINRENQNLNLLKNVKIYFKTKKELDNYCKNEQILHQGFMAEIERLEYPSLKDFINKKKDINLACLQGVTDPRNIGSVIRSAASFNIDGLIVKERNFPEISKSMYKSSSGSIEYINIFKVSNINTTLKFLKTQDFWVSAFDASAKKDFTENNWKGKNVLLFGSEGSGLKEKILTSADFRYKISISNNLESLNISNSVAIVSHFINFVKK